MKHTVKPSRKRLIYSSIIGLVLVSHIIISALAVLANYPTEAHRSVARQLDVFTQNMWSGEDFTKIMDSDEYKKAAESPEAKYSNTATGYALLFTAIADVTIIGVVYYYLRKHRITTKVVGVTVLLVSVGQLLPLFFTPFVTAMYLGTVMPGIGTIVFMSFIGIVIVPLVIAIITRIFDWYYNRKHSFLID